MSRYRNICITLIFSVLLHFIIFYLSPFHISADVPEKKEVRVVFKIKNPAKKKVVSLSRRVMPRRPVNLIKKIVPLKKKIITEKAVKLAKNPMPVRGKTETGEIMRLKKIMMNPEKQIVRTLMARADHRPVRVAKSTTKAVKHITGTERPASPTPEPVTDNQGEEIFKFKDLVRSKIEKKKVYPIIARRMGIEGDVQIGFTILPDGSVSDIKILSDIPAHKLLKRAAVMTIKKAAPYLPVPPGLIEKNGIRIKLKIAYKLT